MRIPFSAFTPKKISYKATSRLYAGLLSLKTFTCRTSAFQQIFAGPIGLEIAMGHPRLQHRILFWGYIIAYSLTSELGKRAVLLRKPRANTSLTEARVPLLRERRTPIYQSVTNTIQNWKAKRYNH